VGLLWGNQTREVNLEKKSRLVAFAWLPCEFGQKGDNRNVGVDIPSGRGGWEAKRKECACRKPEWEMEGAYQTPGGNQIEGEIKTKEKARKNGKTGCLE